MKCARCSFVELEVGLFLTWPVCETSKLIHSYDQMSIKTSYDRVKIKMVLIIR